MARLATAYCECGYSVNSTNEADFAVYTDILENDFLHTYTTNFSSVGWRPQEYNVSKEDARGAYGKQFLPENVQGNPLKDKKAWSGDSEHGGEAGLQLWVRGDHSNGFVSGAEMTSVRNDLLYGSFRVAMKLSQSSGTCGAFFWFYNNTQEIDMEFLSKQFNASTGAVNLVLQSPQSKSEGYDASNTSDFKVQHLPFQPDKDFHEYRFDWAPSRVSFFVDGTWLQDFTENVPTEPGYLFMNHWSNGDPLWSAGPPSKDTAMTISYIKAYFNSSDTARQKDYTKRCPKLDKAKVCQIPDQKVAPSQKSNWKTYFFSTDKGHTPGQTVSMSGALSRFAATGSGVAYIPMLIALLSAALAI
ncbi:concanavalin A-like lectin/glucanase domain-containing protein [Clohesyomyces aquaticus]|uniref:Concanavalin A-like lectin/glucanase domain-containing protein n=1 Tax=Clohesyomyces aquaticus TaxID=1231657 RepID=A0A1Y2AAG2_9PLEO|nr:concanavalin A-like lectin/glucanase domain-containing protein [Clohesyomyces aquaticus]